MSKSTQKLARVIGLPTLAFILTFAACVTAPVTGRKQIIAVPESEMNQMGEEAYQDMLHKEKISTDKKLTAEVVEIGKRIAKASGAKYDWQFTLFESKEVNAFCLPGGKVGVYTGILKTAKNNAGLAAILAHEVGHATAHHSAERATQVMLVDGVLIGVNAAMHDSRYKQEIMAALGLGTQVGLLLPFSRKHEAEADSIGLEYMAKAGYDPHEAIALWDRMAKLGGNPPEIISTHPNPGSRAKALQHQIPEVMPDYEHSQKVPTTSLF